MSTNDRNALNSRRKTSVGGRDWTVAVHREVLEWESDGAAFVKRSPHFAWQSQKECYASLLSEVVCSRLPGFWLAWCGARWSVASPRLSGGSNPKKRELYI